MPEYAYFAVDPKGRERRGRLKAANDAAAEAVPEEAVADWGAPVTDVAADWAQSADDANKEKPEVRPRKEREVEEEDNTLTLDQYLVKKKELDTNLPKIETTRKANEETGDDIWKDAVALERNEEEEAYFIGKVCQAGSFVAKFF